jgi:hypothetical protein
MRHSAIALSGPQTNTWIAYGGPCSAETAPEPNPIPSQSVQPRIARVGPSRTESVGQRLLSTVPRTARSDRTPWLGCEEKSATIAPAVGFEQACSATRWLGRR